MPQTQGGGHVSVAGAPVPFETAISVLRGYCLATETATWVAPKSGVGDDVGELTVGAFAFATYDGVAPAPSTDLEPIDVLVADALNAQMRARDIAGVLAVAREIGEQITRIDESGVKFWTLSLDQVSTAPLDQSAPEWPLWRAWTILMGVPGVEVARAHKTLHHKRPSVFPLIDNETIPWLREGGSAWATVHRDLTSTAGAWSELEVAIGEALSDTATAAPTRLRLHDILLWTRVTKRWEAALAAGENLKVD